MTTCIIHGDPGSRKTATLVGQYGIPALYDGRTVITNIRGFDSLQKVEEVYKKPLPKGAKLIAIPFSRDGFKEMGTFFHWAEKGALILMDEGQRVYPTRLRKLDYYDCRPPRQVGIINEATGEPEDIETVEEAFDCHRHMGWDIYISTPNIDKIHKEIRQVAEYGYRQKDLSGILPGISYILGDIKRVKHNAENSGTALNSAIESTTHRIDKRVFGVYQSTATGVAKGTTVKPSLFAQPKLLALFALVGWGLYNMASNISSYGTLFPTSAQLQQTAVDPVADNGQKVGNLGSEERNSKAGGVSAGAGDFREIDQAAGGMILENLYSYDGYIRSDVGIKYLFTMKIDGDLVTVNSDDFPQFSYKLITHANYIIVAAGDLVKLIYTRRYPYIEDPTYQTIDPTASVEAGWAQPSG